MSVQELPSGSDQQNEAMKKDEKRQDGFLLWQAANAWQRRMKNALAPLGITHVQFLILDTLSRIDGNPVRQNLLAEAAGIDVMMASKVLRLMVTKKLVQRRSPRHDARAFTITLTDSGLLTLSKAKGLVEKSEAEFFEKLVSKRKKFFLNLEALAAEEKS